MDEKRRNYGEIKTEIINILSDEQVHTLDEINIKLNNKIGKIISKQHLCTSITQLISNGEEIVRVGTGEYCKKKNGNDEIPFDTKIVEMCKEWNKTLESELSYNLTGEQFERNRKLYEINVKYIRDICKTIKLH